MKRITKRKRKSFWKETRRFENSKLGVRMANVFFAKALDPKHPRSFTSAELDTFSDGLKTADARWEFILHLMGHIRDVQISIPAPSEFIGDKLPWL